MFFFQSEAAFANKLAKIRQEADTTIWDVSKIFGRIDCFISNSKSLILWQKSIFKASYDDSSLLSPVMADMNR